MLHLVDSSGNAPHTHNNKTMLWKPAGISLKT
uniref:Uncharacterized protein n=1 Tax=Anguilla anguilla TaxID=7936 RepID=A0A0E9PFL2_ANGAN